MKNYAMLIRILLRNAFFFTNVIFSENLEFCETLFVYGGSIYCALW